MATFYSSFFSSGLLAVDSDGGHRPRTPDPTTPRAFTRGFADDTTPTASSFSVPTTHPTNDVLPALLAQTEAITISADKPRLRRRRSSVGLSSSPVAPLKAAPPLPRAAVHLQRQSMPTGMMSPNRSRSGSITDLHRSAMSTDATKTNSLMGRLRSGSVGNSLRTVSRRVRKPAAAPAPPPPTAPLPAPPKLCLPPGSADLATLPHTPRRPLSRRAQTADGVPVVLHTPSISIPRRSATGMEDSLPSSPLVSSFTAEDDYPTPLETPGEVRGEYFA